MADNLLEHIGDLTQVINQKDADFFEIESTDDANNPVSRKESRQQLKTNMAASGPVPDMVNTQIDAAAGIHDFETVRFYRKGATILRLGSLWRAKAAFTSGTGFIADDWEKIPAGQWGSLFGDITDQADLAAILDDLQMGVQYAVSALPNKANKIIRQQTSLLSQASIGNVLGTVTFDTSTTPGAPPDAGSITLDDGSRFDVDTSGDMTYTAADTTVTPIYTGGTWDVGSIDTGTAAVTSFLNTAGGAWEAGSWVSGETKIDLSEVKQTADDAEGKSTAALAGLAAETLRAQIEEGKKLNKSATCANGSTQIANDDGGVGLNAVTTQTDKGTSANIFTQTKVDNPVVSGMAARSTSAPDTNNRQFLFVIDAGGNVKVHLRKNKGAPAQVSDLSDNDDTLNKGEIIALINTVIGSISQGLLTPDVIDKESNLPDASTVVNGTYYVVQELDITAPGQQGRAWKNDSLSTTDWQIVIDNVFAPDETWLSLDDDGELTIADSIRALINGAVQESQIEQTLPETDDQADESKLISRRAAFLLAEKDSLDAETTNRTNADSNLQTALNAEIADRVSETGYLQGIINQVAADLGAETTNRTTADTSLQEAINDEIADRTSAVSNAISTASADATDKADTAENNAKQYTDDLALATQKWLPSVQTSGELPDNPGAGTYLCRVITGADYGVYQWIGTSANPAWTFFSDNLDFIDRIANPVTNNIPVITENGELKDGGNSISGILTTISNGLAAKENTVASGTTSQYYRGDKTWVAFPSIPAPANSGVLTIQKNGVSVDTFGANDSANKTINITISKGDAGLANVDNTSDANKPISNAVQTALNAKEPAKYIAANEEDATSYSSSHTGVMVFYPEE